MTELQKVRVIDVPAPIRRHGAWIQKITAKRVDAAKLKAELKAMLDRGEIREAFDWSEVDGVITVYVERLREPRSRMPWYAAMMAGGMGVAVGAGVLLWESRYVILTAVGIALMVGWVLVKSLAGHSAACPGLHCSGCQN